jgi:hypothetical protein
MINIIALATFLETKLNTNTEGLIFRVYTFEKTLDRRYELINGTKTNFIPAIITTPVGSYLPYNDLQGSRISFNLELMLPLKDKQDWLDMVNSFVYTINGKVFYLKGSNITDNPPEMPYTTMKLTCQVPSITTVSPANFELAQDIASYLPIDRTMDYLGINIPVGVKTINGFNIGDEAIVSIAPITATPSWTTGTAGDITTFGNTLSVVTAQASQAAFNTWLNANHTLSTTYATAIYTSGGTTYRAKNPYHPVVHNYYKLKFSDFAIKQARYPITEHFIGQPTAQSFISQNDTKFITTIYYEKNAYLDEIVSNSATGENTNKEYWLKVQTTSTATPTYTKTIIYDTSAIFPIDDFNLISLSFVKGL